MSEHLTLAVEADIPAIFDLYAARVAWMDAVSIRQWNVTDYLQAYPADYYLEQCRAGRLYAWKDADGGIVGAVVLLCADECWADAPAEDACYVHNLVTDPAVHGAGRALLAAAEAAAAAQGKRRMRLDCAVDNAFLNRYYAAVGYTPAGTCTDGPYVGNRMEKLL